MDDFEKELYIHLIKALKEIANPLENEMKANNDIHIAIKNANDAYQIRIKAQKALNIAGEMIKVKRGLK